MAQILFNTLKKRIIKEITPDQLTRGREGEFILLNKNLLALGEGHVRIYPNDITKELLKKIIAVVENWDIRQVNKLAEIFPDVVPSWVANCNIEYTEKGFVLVK